MATPDEIFQAARAFRMVRGTDTSILHVTKLNDSATLPSYGSGEAAGLDLHADLSDLSGDIFLVPGERRLIKTGIAIAVPLGCYGRIAPRSGLAYKSGIDVMAGVIDSDYRGDVGVILINHGHANFHVSHGDRIAQLIIEMMLPSLVVEQSSLPESIRGDNGFGSTGI